MDRVVREGHKAEKAAISAEYIGRVSRVAVVANVCLAKILW